MAGKTPVYVDESGFSNTDVRRYAYAPKGSCVSDKISGSYRYASTSLIAARIGDCFTVPLLFQGACDSLAFNVWLEHQLCPLLDETHVVILDNAPFHKGSETARLIAETGRVYCFYPRMLPNSTRLRRISLTLNEPGNTTQKSLLTKS